MIRPQLGVRIGQPIWERYDFPSASALVSCARQILVEIRVRCLFGFSCGCGI